MKIKNSRHNWKYASLAETKQKERREKIIEKRVEDIWSNRKRIELSKKAKLVENGNMYGRQCYRFPFAVCAHSLSTLDETRAGFCSKLFFHRLQFLNYGIDFGVTLLLECVLSNTSPSSLQ